MTKIGLDKLRIYQKYDGEYALLFEPWANKKDQRKISSVEFSTLQLIEDNLAMLRSDSYSDNLVKEMNGEIENAKSQMTEEVFDYLVNGKKLIIESSGFINWIKKLFHLKRGATTCSK